MNNRTNAFDTVLSLDEKKTDQGVEIVVTQEMQLEDTREELLYFRERANDYNKKACIVSLIGIIAFIALSFSNVLSVDVLTLIKIMSVTVGIAIALLLVIALFFTFLFTLGYLKLKKAMGLAIGGFMLFCIIPFLSIFVLAAIPLWNSIITRKLNKLFVAGGLEPVLVNEDPL